METILRAMGKMVQIATAHARQMNGATRTHIDLFSGIGGFALACRWAGIKTIAFCEIEKYAQRVLRKNFPGIRIFEDVRKFPAIEFREPFLLTGGYPCQPFSQAGKRRGAEDDRHLWPSMFGIIRTSRPTWILAENVAGHVTLGLDEVLADLEGEDYAVQPIIVPACAVDAPHRRDRVWILANAKSHGLQGRTQSKDGERYFEQDGTTDKPSGTSGGDSSRILGNSKKRSGNERSRRCNENRELQISKPGNASREIAFANSEYKRREQCEHEKQSRYQKRLSKRDCSFATDSNRRRCEKRESERKPLSNFNLESESDGRLWSAEPDVGRVAHGIPRRVDRLRGLGNAIVPQVAYEIIKAMIEADERFFC